MQVNGQLHTQTISPPGKESQSLSGRSEEQKDLCCVHQELNPTCSAIP
jgi:hypothetical protein